MTRESALRLQHGGNSKGAVPVHGTRSNAAALPLYDAAAVEAGAAAIAIYPKLTATIDKLLAERDALRAVALMALEDLDQASSFFTMKARRRQAKTLAALRAALGPNVPMTGRA